MSDGSLQTGPAQTSEMHGWRSLVDLDAVELWRGTVFRLQGSVWPHEQVVDLMLVENHEASSGLSLIVATGYKAGLTLVQLPAEALYRDGARSLGVEWLRCNWAKWVYPEVPVNQVNVMSNYPSNFLMSHADARASRDLVVD